MNQAIVRIKQIIIENFKNVNYGKINLENNRKNYKTSILGLYGQNGSGKTALIDSIQLLKFALTGQQIPPVFSEYINIDASKADFEFLFDIKKDNQNYQIEYKFSLRKAIDNSVQNFKSDSDEATLAEKYRVEIYNEVISCDFAGNNKKNRKAPIINTVTNEVFIPRPKYQLLIGKNKKVYTDLLVAKKLASATSRSFIFSNEFLNTIRLSNDNNKSFDYSVYTSLIEALVNFGNIELFVINTTYSGMISLNAQPLVFKYETQNKGAVGTLMLPLEKPVTIPQTEVYFVRNMIDNMNIVLEQIIPGLTINLKEIGVQLLPDGNNGLTIQLMSCKNSREIPLCYESEGIKKIISILQLLIVIYNQSSITVAIDELDAGLFEYLLGELLRVISEKGKGQLIFTSHNLRPLETLDKGFIAFTTTNPSNRYIRFSNIKGTNNLRDFYFRDIVLGEQSEEVYNPTNNAEIALAFREAGEVCGSKKNSVCNS